jgi:hypothetical protein
MPIRSAWLRAPRASPPPSAARKTNAAIARRKAARYLKVNPTIAKIPAMVMLPAFPPLKYS